MYWWYSCISWRKCPRGRGWFGGGPRSSRAGLLLDRECFTAVGNEVCQCGEQLYSKRERILLAFWWGIRGSTSSSDYISRSPISMEQWTHLISAVLELMKMLWNFLVLRDSGWGLEYLRGGKSDARVRFCHRRMFHSLSEWGRRYCKAEPESWGALEAEFAGCLSLEMKGLAGLQELEMLAIFW